MDYVRTDRNGTKYFADWTCPRCGGAGQSTMWIRTGLVCFACGGTGRRNVAKIVKVFTPEYDAKRAERESAKAATPERVAADEESRRTRMQNNGFGADGRAYVHTGKTYALKAAFKSAGGRWVQELQAWVCPTRIDASHITVTEISFDDVDNGPMFCLGWGNLEIS